MKTVIHENPTGKGVKYIWENVQVEVTNDMDEESKSAFIDKLGSFDVIAKSLYNVRHAKVPPAPRDQLEFDTTCLLYTSPSPRD